MLFSISWRFLSFSAIGGKNLKKKYPDLSIDDIDGNWNEELKYEVEALKALEKSHVVLYVATLSVVPNDSHQKEIEITKTIQPRMVAVLNQGRKEFNSYIQEGLDSNTAKSYVDNRIEQWKKIFENNGIKYVVIFDAHWDNPKKIDEIYEGVYRILDPKYQELFRKGLELFGQKQDYISQKAYKILASSILDCQKKSTVSVKKGQYVEKEVREKIENEFFSVTIDFLEKVTQLYKIAAEYPSATKDQLKLKIKELRDIGARMTNGGVSASIFGTGSAAIGAAIGATAAGVVSGGMGAGAGAILGSQIAAIIGSALGGLLLVTSDIDDNVIIQAESEQIRDIVATNLATLWAVSNVGYGRDREVAQGEVEEIKNKISNSKFLLSDIDWKDATPEIIISRCKSIIEELEAV